MNYFSEYVNSHHLFNRNKIKIQDPRKKKTEESIKSSHSHQGANLSGSCFIPIINTRDLFMRDKHSPISSTIKKMVSTIFVLFLCISYAQAISSTSFQKNSTSESIALNHANKLMHQSSQGKILLALK